MKKRVNITIEEHVLKSLDEMAKARGVDRSTMISILIYDSKNLIDVREQGGDTSNFVSSFAHN